MHIFIWKNLNIFFDLKAQGLDPYGSCLIAKKRGFTLVMRIKMLRLVYGLTLEQAKEEVIKVDHGGISLSDYQASLLPSLKAAIEADGLD